MKHHNGDIAYSPSLQVRTRCSTSAAPQVPPRWCWVVAGKQPWREFGEFEREDDEVESSAVDSRLRSRLRQTEAASAVRTAAMATAAVCTPATQGLGHDSARGGDKCRNAME